MKQLGKNSRKTQKTLHCFLVYTLILIIVGPVLCRISVNKIVLRLPREGDIGLIFDINLINTANEEKEMLEYHIRPNRECSVNLTQNTIIGNSGKVLGGSFGRIEPGAMQTVSVIWPTTIVFNRVGFCDIVINSINMQNEEKNVNQQLQFDTRFTKIDPTSATFQRRKEYVDCGNWDLNYLKDCDPYNCEEKYMGKRSYYNRTTSSCESTPKCNGKNMIYDIYINECNDVKRLLTTTDIEKIKGTTNENEYVDLKNEPSGLQEQEFKSTDLEVSAPVILSKRETKVWYGVLTGLSIVLTTIVVYVTVCFFIFFFLNWISKRSAKNSR